MTGKLTRWEVADHIKTAEEQALYLDACLKDCGEDSALMVQVLRDIASAQSVDDLAKLAGVDPDYLSDGCELSLETFIKVAHVLGFQLSISCR